MIKFIVYGTLLSMAHQKDISLINWYTEMGITEVIKNSSCNNKEKISKIFIENTSKDVLYNQSTNSLVDNARNIANNIKNLKDLKLAIENFDGLYIKKGAKNTVFADGNQNSPIMIIGEAPGENEDIKGIPFCGQSGQLMDRMFAFADFSREKNLYITNSVFWRPPGNRKPTKEENDVCLPFVEKHIALINPKILVLVGATSAQTLLNNCDAISNMRNKNYKYTNTYLKNEIDVLVMFHPSYLLRQPSQKKHTWNDILKIKNKLIEK